MNVLNLIRKVNSVGRRHYHPSSTLQAHEKYLRECDELFMPYLEEQLGSSYLFSALTFRDRRKGDAVAFVNPDRRYYYSPTYQHIFKPLIEGNTGQTPGLLESIESGATLSVTLNLMRDPWGFDLFFEGKHGYSSPIREFSPASDIVKIHFFSLHELNFDPDFDVFCSLNLHKLHDFLELSSFRDSDRRKAASLLWHYKQMEIAYLKDCKDADFIVHFIRPAFIDFDYNLLLSLATNSKLEDTDLSTINLLIYKMASVMATESIKRHEEIARLKNVSASTHVIKTSVNGLFGPPLNSLLQGDKVDPRIRLLQSAKEKILIYTEIINLVAKLSSSMADAELLPTLVASGLFTNSYQPINIHDILENVLETRKLESAEHNLIFTTKVSGVIDKNFLARTGMIFPAANFYELLLLTTIENAIQHGATDTKGNVEVTMRVDREELSFSNKAKPNSKPIVHLEDLTGNFRVFNLLVSKLAIGVFDAKIVNGIFIISIRNIDHEK